MSPHSVKPRKSKQDTLYVARARHGPGERKAIAEAGGGGRYIYVLTGKPSRVCDVNTKTKRPCYIGVLIKI